MNLIASLLLNAPDENNLKKTDLEQMFEVVKKLRIDGAVFQSLQAAKITLKTTSDSRFNQAKFQFQMN